MKNKLIVTGLISASLLALSAPPASAHGFHHGRYALFGVLGAGVAVAAAVLTAPVRIIADVAEPPVYAPPPAYPVYGYSSYQYYPQQTVVYGYPQGYYRYR
ncbi:MAG: mechanosensitive ion channel protein MscS [Alphaproteobacteria bacterium]|nr:mechanosensitive ion channel protein MscS [Alphaproteobacteria bacterium]